MSRGTRTRASKGPDLVLSDWAIGFENFPSEPFAILTELMMHALLYERVYLQDENIVISRRLSKAFMSISTEDADRLLGQLFDIGALHILTLANWPPELADLFLKRPIYARALYVHRYGARPGAHAFVPSHEQWKFYDLLDSILSNRRHLIHPARSPAEIIPVFHSTTKEVLGKPHYKGWIAATAGSIPRRMKEDFLSYIDDPGKGARRLHESGKAPRVVGSADHQPVFMRGLGYQLASLYERRYARAMERVLQSTFNASFCHSQGANGRFGKGLAEVVLETGASLEEPVNGTVRIEQTIETDVPLPSYFDDFGAVFASVRTSDAVQLLRQSVHDPASTVIAADHAWKSVAEELGSRVTPGRKQTMTTAIAAFGREFFKATIAKILSPEIVGAPSNPIQIVVEAGIAGIIQGVYQAGPLVPAMLRRGYRQEQLLTILLGAFRTRCTEVEVVNPDAQNSDGVEIRSFSPAI